MYGESSELVIVIENKVNARENYNHSNQGQTLDYYHYVESHKTSGQRALYFFITADEKQTAYADMYVQISYQEIKTAFDPKVLLSAGNHLCLGCLYKNMQQRIRKEYHNCG